MRLPFNFVCIIVFAITATQALEIQTSSEVNSSLISEARNSLHSVVAAVEQAQADGRTPILSDISANVDAALDALTPLIVISEIPGSLSLAVGNALNLLMTIHNDAAEDATA